MNELLGLAYEGVLSSISRQKNDEKFQRSIWRVLVSFMFLL